MVKITWIIGVLIFFQNFVSAQSDSNYFFLQRIGIQDSIYSNVLKESRKIYIQFPEGYDPQKKQKYPVAYIIDGEVFLPTVYDVQKYYSGGFTPEMLLVGISNDLNRIRDLTPSKITHKYGMPFNEKNGESANFMNFIELELIPYIEEKYAVTNYRTLIGHSYGGLFAISVLLDKPDLFANYLAIDPSLDWDDQKILKEAKKKVTKKKYKNKGLFISLSGQLHMQNSQITIENVMQDTTDYTLFARSNISFTNLIKEIQDSGLSFNWKFYPNDIHGTVAFPSIREGLISLFKWYQMEHTDKINSFDTPREELFRIIKHREEKLKKHFGYFEPPYPEELLNMSGYMNMEMKEFEKAKMYFEAAVKYFPESANVYDSMADYYIAKKEVSNALKFLQIALELTGDDYYKNKIQTLKKQ